ncbi:unnamed protein product, partial [Symbiodinium microadriaticum]
MRENPGNSLHWFDTVEQYLENTGAWSDFKYFACVFLAARRKFQIIRHNLASMQMLPFHQCGHLHDPHEWSPGAHDSGISCPSADEAEYSASLCFTLVVAASHWAVDKGYAVLRIQRLPPVQVSGDWRGLVKLPPKTFREDAMGLMASHVGLMPSADSALRVQVQDVWQRGEPLPADVVYIGHSHFSHRLPVTCWENPFVAGRDGSPELVVFKYMQWLPKSGLEQRLPELRGKKLACDCGASDLCHGDFLLGLLLPSTDVSGYAQKPEHVRRILLAAMAGLQIPGSVAYPISQSSIVSAAQSLVQGSSRLSLRWPYIEDLVNSPHFTAFGDWLRERGLPDAGVLGPRALGSACVMAQRASAADQGAVASKRHALPPVVPYGQTADSHFRCALDVQLHGCPLDWEAVVDHDVQFAAASMATDLARLRRIRADAMALLKELAVRLWPVSQQLHAVQHPDVHSVNPRVHLALFAVCVVLLAWPDTSLVQGLLEGFPAVGYQEPCGVWQSKPARFCTLQDALSEGKRDAEAVVSSLRPSEDDQVVWEAGEKDEKAGFCHPSVGWQELTAAGRLFRVIRRFVVTQASGKKRVIDDALAGRQSEFSSDANKLQFCSAIQPCLHAQALAAELARQGKCCAEWPDTLATAGEDLPDAYRKIPMRPDHAWACVVAYNDCRDWSSLATETQLYVEELFELFGFPFSTEKRQEPAAAGDFLGLMHDFSQLQQGTVRVWVRERLVEKIGDIIREAQETDTLKPGQASKLYGCVTFLDQGVFGRVARAGLTAIKDRQYASRGHARLTDELRSAFDTIRAVLDMRPQRLVRVLPQLGSRVLAASDAAQDACRIGSGGFLVVTPKKERLGAVVPVDDAVFHLWDEQETKIAQLESDSPELDHMAQTVHILLFHLRCYLYFEWVPSGSNWADGISRDGFE